MYLIYIYYCYYDKLSTDTEFKWTSWSKIYKIFNKCLIFNTKFSNKKEEITYIDPYSEL